jgi:hypothetical protein
VDEGGEGESRESKQREQQQQQQHEPRVGRVTGCGSQQKQDDRAMAWVARLIGLPEPTAPSLGHGNNDAGSDAATEPICEESLSLMPSIIPETPLSGGEDVESDDRMDVALSEQIGDQNTAARCSVRMNDAPKEARGVVIVMEEGVDDGTERMEIGEDGGNAMRRAADSAEWSASSA